MANDDSVLKEAQDRFKRWTEGGAHNRREAEVDRGYLNGMGVWSQGELDERREAGRPALVFDELNQHTNALVNRVRINRIGITVEPDGEGADKRTAELREKAIRGIQYKSRAQEAMTYGFECATEGGYGYWRVSKERKKGSFDQELMIKRIQDPDSVVWDASCTMANGVDAKGCFVTEWVDEDDFKRRWPGAKQMSFSTDERDAAPQWFKGDAVLVCEYFRIRHKRKKLYGLRSTEGAESVAYEEDLAKEGIIVKNDVAYLVQPDGMGVEVARVVNEDVDELPYVERFVLNGVEVLERPGKYGWTGSMLPIVRTEGKGFWYKGKWWTFSLIRLARDPAKLLCFSRTTEAEMIGNGSKTPYIGAEGQFDKHEKEWETVNKTARAYIEYKAEVEGLPGQLLPPPQRLPFEPPINSLEVCAESARRAIQAAVGTSPLPTNAQKMNDKSGIALQQIQEQTELGSYHLVGNYLRAIERTGMIIDEQLAGTYDTPRSIPVMGADNKAGQLMVNAPTEDPETGELVKYEWGDGAHTVIVSTGKSFTTERQEGKEIYASINTPEMLMTAINGNSKAAAISANAFRLLDAGMYVEKIADIIDPEEKEGNPAAKVAEMQGQLQQAQQVVQALNAHAQQLEQQLKQAQAGNETKLAIAAQNNETKLVIEELRAMLAESQAALKAQLEEMRVEARTAEQGAAQAHEVGMAGMRAAQMPEPGPQEMA